jgi:uncharacterized small protein (DUF1192 family)
VNELEVLQQIIGALVEARVLMQSRLAALEAEIARLKTALECANKEVARG